MSTASALELARQLIARRSVTPHDAGCLDILAARLAPLGFRCERIGANGVDNLWARRGDSAPLVCFAGHTDVVPTGPLDHWTSDPFTPTVREGALYGRGASDMKTSLAAFVAAIEAFVAGHPRSRRLDRGAVYFRRGGPRGGRHGARGGGAAGPRREARLLHRRRADERGAPRRHDQERPPRLAVREPRGEGRTGPRRLPPPGAQPRARVRRRRSPSSRARSGTRATSTSRPPPGKSPTSMPAPARGTSSPASCT